MERIKEKYEECICRLNSQINQIEDEKLTNVSKNLEFK